MQKHSEVKKIFISDTAEQLRRVFSQPVIQDEIKSTNVLLESLKGIFAFDNLISYGLCGYSYFTGADPKITTGLTVLSGIYNVGKITKECISNPMYFLKKISTN